MRLSKRSKLLTHGDGHRCMIFSLKQCYDRKNPILNKCKKKHASTASCLPQICSTIVHRPKRPPLHPHIMHLAPYFTSKLLSVFTSIPSSPQSPVQVHPICLSSFNMSVLSRHVAGSLVGAAVGLAVTVLKPHQRLSIGHCTLFHSLLGNNDTSVERHIYHPGSFQCHHQIHNIRHF